MPMQPGASRLCAAILLVFLAGALNDTPALAQRVPFERSFSVAEQPALDVMTVRGKIEVEPGEPGRIVVLGTVTVRVGLDVPAEALAIARGVAANPPLEQDGHTIRLRPPASDRERRAVTVSYVVRVPPGTNVTSRSESGATAIRGVNGSVSVRTQSAAIVLADLGGTTAVTTGSGSVGIDGAAGDLSVTTSSSGIRVRGVRGNLQIRTGSGLIDALLTGQGDADVRTESSEIRIGGLQGALSASTQSGRVTIEGTPRKQWGISTGSSAIELTMGSGASFTVDAISRSSDVKIEGGAVQGNLTKGRAAGTVGTGGPVVKATTGSGSIRIRL